MMPNFHPAQSHGQLVLAFISLAILLTSSVLVFASPLDHNRATSTAGLKYVGSTCATNAECLSKRCAPTNGNAKLLTCHRQPTNGTCTTDGNCLSRNCIKSNGTCSATSKAGGVCQSFLQCDYLNYDRIDCYDGICKTVYAANAATTLVGPNAICYKDSECLSGSTCSILGSTRCTRPDGQYDYCDESGPDNKHCSRYALGHSCGNDGECFEGKCKSGVCKPSQIGDSCKEQYQCSGASLCGPQGQCYLPANGTVTAPNACNEDSECLSGHCTTSQLQKNNYGTNAFVLDDQEPSCDYLDNGQAGCTSYRNCSTGICTKGTCNLGKDGAICMINYQLLPRASPGPSSTNPTNNATLVDGACDISGVGAKCRTNADCKGSRCISNVCTKAPLGYRLYRLRPVTPRTSATPVRPTRTRARRPDSASHPRPTLKCSKDADCFSKKCETRHCNFTGL
ncbi:hypothetical protein V8E36_006941 [Tilletia maclaganii]